VDENAVRRLDLLRQLAEELGVELRLPGVPREEGGFLSRNLKALCDIAERLDGSFPDATDKERRKNVEDLVDLYIKTETKRSEASKAGGFRTRYIAILSHGKNAKKLLYTLQKRLEYWKSELKLAKNAGDHTRELVCRRFTEVSDAKKHFGRPFAVIGGNMIGQSKGTNRHALLAQFADYYSEMGDEVLEDRFLDAFLDNGGGR
jgi:hypothetical protein